MEGAVDEMVNPFTGKALTDDEKWAHPQYIIASNEWDVSKNNGKTFLPSHWLSIHDDIWIRENWICYSDDCILPE